MFVTAPGSDREFAIVMVDQVSNLGIWGSSGGQYFPRATYVRIDGDDLQLLDDDVEHGAGTGYRRIDNISPALLTEYRSALGADITSDDVFDYIYGLLHSTEYRTRFAADLNKMLPRTPRVATREAFDAFAGAGRELGDLHVGYEAVDPYSLEEVETSGADDARERNRVTKMRFGAGKDRSTIIYNAHVTLTGIPEEAYRYQLGPRSAIEWIMDRYQVRTDKASGIVNDPNDWSREVDDPRYIIDLLKRIVTVSLETNRIVESLPPLEVE